MIYWADRELETELVGSGKDLGSLDVMTIYEEYARELGVDDLTEAQRQQAVLNAIIKRGEEIAKDRARETRDSDLPGKPENEEGV